MSLPIMILFKTKHTHANERFSQLTSPRKPPSTCLLATLFCADEGMISALILATAPGQRVGVTGGSQWAPSTGPVAAGQCVDQAQGRASRGARRRVTGLTSGSRCGRVRSISDGRAGVLLVFSRHTPITSVTTDLKYVLKVIEHRPGTASVLRCRRRGW